MNGDITDMSIGSVKEYEESLRKRVRARAGFYENLLTYIQTGVHKEGLTNTRRRHVLKMALTHSWNDTDEILYYHDRGHKQQVVRSLGEMATILHLYHTQLFPMHIGYRATHDHIKRHYYWKGMLNDIKHYIKKCQRCQQCKIPVRNQAQHMQTMKEPSDIFGMNLIASPGTTVTDSGTSAMLAQWRDEAELSLIEEVRANPALWDTSDPDYTNKLLKKQLYIKIAMKLQAAFPNVEGFTADVVMNRFNIMKTFWGELVNMKQTKSRSRCVYVPTWQLFEPLSFLSDTVIPGLSEPLNDLSDIVTPGPSESNNDMSDIVTTALSESLQDLSDSVSSVQSVSSSNETPVPEDCPTYEQPIIVHTYTLGCDDEMTQEATPISSFGSIFINAAPSPTPPPLYTHEPCSPGISNDSATTTLEISAESRKRKKPPEQEKESAMEETSEPEEQDVPYACGIIVQSTFRQYPKEQHVELLARLSDFLTRLQIEVKNKNDQ